MNRMRRPLLAVAMVVLAAPAACTLLLPEPEPAVPICGRLEPEACDEAIELVRQVDPGAFTGDPVPVLEFVCGPGQRCQAGYEALVVLVHPGWTDIEDLPVYVVFGMQGPETVLAREGPLPDHIVDLLPEER